MNEKDFEKLEEETKFQVIKLEETESDSNKKEIIDNLSKELEKIFTTAKEKIHDARTSEEAEAAMKTAKEKAEALFNTSKAALKDFKEDERVQDVILKINRTWDSAVTTISENETVQNLGEKIDDFVHSDSVQDGIKTAKKTTLKFADKAHAGLKKLLDDDSKESEDKEETNEE